MLWERGCQSRRWEELLIQAVFIILSHYKPYPILIKQTCLWLLENSEWLIVTKYIWIIQSFFRNWLSAMLGNDRLRDCTNQEAQGAESECRGYWNTSSQGWEPAWWPLCNAPIFPVLFTHLEPKILLLQPEFAAWINECEINIYHTVSSERII